MKMWKILGAALLSTAVTLTSTPSATAQEVAGAITVEEGKQVAKPLEGDQKAVVEKAIKTEEISLGTKTSNLALDRAVTAENRNGEVLVMIPITNEGSEYSNLTLMLDSTGQSVESYKEAHFFEETENSGRAVIWDNGKKIKDERVEATASDVDDYTTEGVGDAISELNRCLAAAGIPAWIIAAAGFVCSFASLPGFIACLIAAGVGGGTAGYCGIAAWSKL